MCNTELAWAAGLFDGEGHVAIGTSRPHNTNRSQIYYMFVALNMTDPAAVSRFHTIVGVGSIRAVTKQPSTKNNNARKTLYMWRATTQEAAVCLEKLLPYLCNKRPQAEIALAYQASMKWRGRIPVTAEELARRHDVYETLRSMKATPV